MKRLLVATDLSERSAPALHRAAQLIREQPGSTWSWLHVVDDDAPASFVHAQVQRVEALLREQARELGEQVGVTPQVIVLRGRVERCIVEVAEQMPADLLLVGLHRPNRLRELFTGTTVGRIVRACHVPVLRVGNAVRGAYRRALLALDLSAASLQALHSARDLGLLDLERYEAAYAIAPIPMSVVAHSGGEGRFLQNQASEMREQLLRELREAGIELPGGRLHLRVADAADALQQEVTERGADLLVMGTHARQGLQRFLVGSVASRVLEDHTGDVLVVPPRL